MPTNRFVRSSFPFQECNDINPYCYEVEKELIDNGFDKHRENPALEML